MASGSHKYSANEALAFILASDSDESDSFGDESSLDSSDSHDSEKESGSRGTEVDEIQKKRPAAADTFQKLLASFVFFWYR